MLSQPVERRRCASCTRWSGTRQPGAMPGTVEVESEMAIGLCMGGPWNESERKARSACGHWKIWPAVAGGDAETAS